MIESGNVCKDDYSIKVGAAEVSIQWTKKNKGSLKTFSTQLTASWWALNIIIFCMHYNQYLYQLTVQAVLITDTVKNSISAADVIADPIIGTSLMYVATHLAM